MAEELPIGWVRTTLGQIAEPSRVRAMPSEDPEIPYVGLEHVESQTMRLIGHGHAYDVRSSSVRFAGGDVLYVPTLIRFGSQNSKGCVQGSFLFSRRTNS